MSRNTGTGLRLSPSRVLAAAGLLLPTALWACSGPPPPQVTILPTTITYSYIDTAGAVQTVDPTELFDLADPTATDQATYYYCGDPAASPNNCFDAASNTAILEIPAGATVTFGSFQYQPQATPPTSGLVNDDLDSIQAMINRIAGTNGGRSISLGEISARGTGGAFDPGGGVNSGGGIKPRLIIDWAGLDPSRADYVPPAPDSYKMIIGSGHELSQPPDWAESWDPRQERWYFPSGQTFEGQAQDVVRMVDKNMNSHGNEEYWIAHEERGGKLGRLHFWALVGGYMSTGSGRIGLEGNGKVTSTWNFDLPPTSAGDIPANFVHRSFNGDDSDGVAAPQTAQENVNSFTNEYTFETPSEPGAYMVRNDMQLLWAYGTEQNPSGGHWAWRTALYYAGYADLEPMAVDTTSTEGADFLANLASIRSQLRCLPGDVLPNSHDCEWDDSFDPTSAVGAFSSGDIRSMVEVMGIPSATAASIDLSNLTMTIPSFTPPYLPSGTSQVLFQFSGLFPQTTAGNGGTPGKAMIIVRDVRPPPYVRFEASQNYPSESAVLDTGSAAGGSGSDVAVVMGAETGRLLSDSLGTRTKLDVVVFDDNPGQVAFAERNGATVLRADGTTPVTNLADFNAIVTDDTRVTPPRIQVWYAIQKAGYSFQAGKYIRIGAESMVDADLDALADRRHEQLGGDSQMVPDPTFRYYPFRDPGDTTTGTPGAIKEYEPYEYQLVERDGEAYGVLMRFEIDLADAREPMGLHFGKGSEELDPDATPPIDYPGYSPFMCRLLARVKDGRLLTPDDPALTSTLPIPADAQWLGFLQGNYAPYFDETVDHEGGFLYATEVFPNDRDIPAVLDTAGALVPPDPPADLKTAAGTLGFDTTKFGSALGIEVNDVVPPTVLLMVKDTKYDRTIFFGNASLGDMSQSSLQEAQIRDGDPLDTSLQEIVPKSITAYDDRAIDPTTGVRLYPPEGAEVSIPYCTTAGESDCLIPPDSAGGNIWTFTFDQGGATLADYENQLAQTNNAAFHPANYFASSTVLPDSCVDNGFLPICRSAQPYGMWVDEDTRLVFRVLVRDNLNAYLTSAATTVLGDFQNLEVSGATSPHVGASGSESLDVRVVDASAGYGGGMRLSDGGSNELKDTWPTYSFRNPNRQDNGGGLDDLGQDAFVEVQYTDRAGNQTLLHVDFFVIENTMRILSLREERQREIR